MHQYFDTILSEYQCGFRKGCNKGFKYNHIKWRESLDKGDASIALLTDLPKVFDVLNMSF